MTRRLTALTMLAILCGLSWGCEARPVPPTRAAEPGARAWKLQEFPESGFRIQLPGPALERRELRRGHPLRFVSVGPLPDNGQAFTVQVRPLARGETPSRALEAERQALLSAHSLRLDEEGAARLAGRPARRLLLRFPAGQLLHVRMAVHEGRIHVLSSMAPDAQAARADAERFFDSWRPR